MKQHFNNYTPEDFDVWKVLFERQQLNLKTKACKEYLDALDDMQEVLHSESIANFSEVNPWLEKRTGWTIHTVPGLIPVDEFFQLLANKKFCSSTWLRTKQQLDYLEEPDMFHDTFGHIPLLSNEVFSDFMHEFGKLGVSVMHSEEKLLMLQRLYWFTIEFGLINQNGLKIYGAGIVSSYGESNLALGNEVEKITFDIEQVLQENFRTDIVQNKYFVIESFEELFESMVKLTSKWKKYELV